MKSVVNLTAIFLLLASTCLAQVGIGIETPDPSSILHLESNSAGLLLPKLTTLQREAITDPAKGLVIYNLDNEGLEINIGTPAIPVWSLLAPTEGSKTLTLYRDLGAGSNNITGNSSFVNFPLNNAHDTEIDDQFFEIIGNGNYRLLASGSYQINASFAVKNLKGGSRKYIFAVFLEDGTTEDVRLGYLARGFAAIPGPASNTEFFGASGTFQYNFSAGDEIHIKYWLDNDNTSLNGDLLHIGLEKL